MALTRFMQKIQDQVVAPAIDGAVSMRTGIITSAYYLDRDVGLDEYKKSPSAVVDVSILDVNGNVSETISAIPMLRQVGVSTSLPAVGSVGVIGYVGGKDGMKFLVGYLDSMLTEPIMSDNVAPKVPPALKPR